MSLGRHDDDEKINFVPRKSEQHAERKKKKLGRYSSLITAKDPMVKDICNAKDSICSYF